MTTVPFNDFAMTLSTCNSRLPQNQPTVTKPTTEHSTASRNGPLPSLLPSRHGGFSLHSALAETSLSQYNHQSPFDAPIYQHINETGQHINHILDRPAKPHQSLGNLRVSWQVLINVFLFLLVLLFNLKLIIC